ncbi:F-box/kelch-repeat protein At3g23880-like [Primulina eburnea]|uniref:F-box/kelch-repeat protein At3g23880-like n=1 Tax=Primulina eburnea TaxID=1245227 RepID=UPI003C6BF3B9
MVKKMKKIAIDGEGDGCALPDAIVEDILSRLRSKTLMKLRIVCKKWKTLISTRYFRRLHDEKSLKYPNLLLLRDSSSHDYVLTTVSLDGDVLDQWNLPLPSGQDLYRLPSQWGPSNLVCFVVNLKRFFVCNPSVRKVIYLPQQQYSEVIKAYGFCYLPSTNQYVIISVSRNQWQMITFSYSNDLKDLSTGGWKPINKNKTPCILDCYQDGVFVNGVFYWVGRTRSSLWTEHARRSYWRGLPGIWNPCFLCFDLYEEKFFDVAFPDGVDSYICTLHDVNGDLHMLSHHGWSSKTLWKLEDVQNQKWIKQYTIKSESYFRTLMVGEDGEMLVYRNEFLEWCIMQDKVVTIRRKGDKILGHCKYVKAMQLHTDTLLMS